MSYTNTEHSEEPSEVELLRAENATLKEQVAQQAEVILAKDAYLNAVDILGWFVAIRSALSVQISTKTQKETK